MFLHFGAEHLFYNMLVLIFLGDVLEKEVGKVRYLLIYLIGGVAGNVLSLWVEFRTGDYAVSAGASGAIFAVIGALVWIVIRNKGKLEEYSGKRLFLMAGLSVAEGLTTSGVDNWAHIGGMAAGFVLAVLLYRKKQRIEDTFYYNE
jgi:rhomboid protease GluP